jgi:hypothetical protein
MTASQSLFGILCIGFGLSLLHCKSEDSCKATSEAICTKSCDCTEGDSCLSTDPRSNIGLTQRFDNYDECFDFAVDYCHSHDTVDKETCLDDVDAASCSNGFPEGNFVVPLSCLE